MCEGCSFPHGLLWEQMLDIVLKIAVSYPTFAINKKVLAARGPRGQSVPLTNTAQAQMEALGSCCKQFQYTNAKVAIAVVSLLVAARHVQVRIPTTARQILQQPRAAERSVIEVGYCRAASRL